jgi:flagellar assembly protein FliH
MSDKKNFNYSRPFSPDDETEQQLQQWFTPDLTAEQAAKQPRSNALNMTSTTRKPAEVSEQDELSIKPLTAADMEQIRQAAYDEGFAEGKDEGFSAGYAEGREQGHQDGTVQGQAEGKKAGLADAEQELAEQRKQLTSLLEQLQQPLLAVNEQVKQQLLALCLAMAKAVINVEAKTNRQVILQAISDATSALPLQSKNVVIKLNPSDIAKVEQFYSAAEIANHGWQLTPAVNVAEGGCLVQSTLSSVDRRIEQRVASSLAHFIELQQLAENSAAKTVADKPEQPSEAAADEHPLSSIDEQKPPSSDDANYTAAEESHGHAVTDANVVPDTDKPLDEEQ